MEQPFAKLPYVIGIAGGTGSGKTTFSRELVATLMTNKIVYLSHDSYYRDLSNLPFSERVKVNFDHPDSLETDLMIKHITALRNGEPVDIPIYNFVEHTRSKETEHIEPQSVILIEGILIFAVKELRDLMRRLRDTGVHNIELVTPSHFTRIIAQALKGADLGVPVVWNSSGYEKAETLRMLDGLVQVYLPDLKYLRSETARRYSAAPDYPEAAKAALKEMFRQRGPCHLDSDGMLQSGLLIRHLILPGHTDESMDVIDYVADSFPRGNVLFSLMSQYTPINTDPRFPELSGTVSRDENENLIHYLHVRHLTDGYWQEPASSGKESIPLFDGTGLDN